MTPEQRARIARDLAEWNGTVLLLPAAMVEGTRPPQDCSVCRQPDCTRLHDAE